MIVSCSVLCRSSDIAAELNMSKRSAERESEIPAKKPPLKLQTSLFSYYKPTAGQNSLSSDGAIKDKPSRSVFAPVHPSTYGLHIYTPPEIENSHGNMKEFRKFWNEKAVELCSDSRVTYKLQGNRSAIEGAIYSSWTLHKTSLLQLRVEKVEAQSSKVYKDEVVKDHVLTVVRKNLQRMLQAQTSVNQLYTEISESESASLESNLTVEISELKKSQEALIKALEKQEADLALAEREEGKLMIADSPVQLPEHELETLVKIVKSEDYQ